MRGAIPPLPQQVFMAWYLVKHRDNFTLPVPYPYSTYVGVSKSVRTGSITK
jgi:hypothetical protein